MLHMRTAQPNHATTPQFRLHIGTNNISVKSEKSSLIVVQSKDLKISSYTNYVIVYSGTVPYYILRIFTYCFGNFKKNQFKYQLLFSG